MHVSLPAVAEAQQKSHVEASAPAGSPTPPVTPATRSCFSRADERIPSKRKRPSRRCNRDDAQTRGEGGAAVVGGQSRPWEEGARPEGAIVSSAVFIWDRISASAPSRRQTMTGAFVAMVAKTKRKTRMIFFPRITAQQRSRSGDVKLLQFKQGGEMDAQRQFKQRPRHRLAVHAVGSRHTGTLLRRSQRPHPVPGHVPGARSGGRTTGQASIDRAAGWPGM